MLHSVATSLNSPERPCPTCKQTVPHEVRWIWATSDYGKGYAVTHLLRHCVWAR